MAEHNFSVENTLTLLLDDKKYHSLRDILSTMNPADIAAVFDELPESKLPLLFRLLPKELAAETFVEMDTDAQALLIRGFSDSELKEVIDELYVDDAVDIVEEMPANVVQRILTQADPEMRKQINEILRYPEDSAGSIMTTEYVSLRPNMTVGEAILRIRRTGDLHPLKIKTMPHPGFPTDMQPLMTTLLTLADGTSIVTEGIWENRFRYVDELLRMGANIQVDGQVAVIEGVKKLRPAPLRATDLRAGAAMIMAALSADGISEVDETIHIERGYENIVEKLQLLGADIRRVETPCNAITRAI